MVEKIENIRETMMSRRENNRIDFNKKTAKKLLRIKIISDSKGSKRMSEEAAN